MPRYLLLMLLFASVVHSETRTEFGPTYLSDESSGGGMLIVVERVGVWDLGVGYVSEQDVWPTWERDNGYPPVHIRSNAFMYGQRVWRKGRFEFGLGVAHFSNNNRALGSRTTYPVVIGWNFNGRLSVRLRHFSNAGSAAPNMGQDALTIGVTL